MEDLSQNIIQLLKDRNEKSIDLIYDNYGANLYGYILKIVKTEAEAQDVLQESLFKIWKYADKYDTSKSRLFTWMLNICRNQAIDKLRQQSKRNEKKIQNPEQVVNNYRITQLNEEHIDLKDHVDKLEQKYKEVVEILFFKGFTQKEASKHLNIPLGTVKTRLKIAVRELQKIFSYNRNVLSILLSILWTVK